MSLKYGGATYMKVKKISGGQLPATSGFREVCLPGVSSHRLDCIGSIDQQKMRGACGYSVWVFIKLLMCKICVFSALLYQHLI